MKDRNALLQREQFLLDRLDNLEGCEDNPVYKQEIEEIRRELFDIREQMPT